MLRGDFQIRLEDVRVYVTQNAGYVTCVEVMNAGNATGRYAYCSGFNAILRRRFVAQNV